jgi:hypothetical protein
MENINDEIQKGYEKYLKIKQRTNECSKKWQKSNLDKAKKNNKTYYNKIKEEHPEKYKQMINKKIEQAKIRQEKKKEEETLHPILQNLYFN